MAINVLREKLTVTWASSAVSAVSATVAHTDGWLKQTSFTMPSMSANVSGSMNVYDTDGNKVYASTSSIMSAAQVGNITGQTVPVNAGYIVEVKLGGTPGSAAGVSATPLTGTIVLFASKDP